MTLADEDTKSIPTDNANRAIQENVAVNCKQVFAIYGKRAGRCVDYIRLMQIVLDRRSDKYLPHDELCSD